MTPMAYAWTLFSGASIIKRRLTWTNDDPFAGSEVYGDVYQVVGVPLFSDEWKACAEAAEKERDELRGENTRHREAAEYHCARAEKLREALQQIEDLPGSHAEDAFFIARAVLEAKP